MACGRCGTDQRLIELIVESKIFEMINDHILQGALQDCDGNWLGRATRVVTCDSLAQQICALIEAGETCLPGIDTFFLTATDELHLTTTDGKDLMVSLSRYRNDGVVTNAVLQGSNLVIRRTKDGEPMDDIVVDLSSLSTTLPESTETPEDSTDPALPTTVVGGRTVLMGEPAGYLDAGGGRLIPYYDEAP